MKKGRTRKLLARNKGEFQCFDRWKWGYIAAFCPNTSSPSEKASKPTQFRNQSLGDKESAPESSYQKSGILDSKSVNVLGDTGSRMSVVQANLVDRSWWKEETAELKCCAW